MDNAVYVALSKQTVAVRQMDVLANNLANSSTSCFKADGMYFREYMVQDADNKKTSYVEDLATYSDFSQGNLERTGSPLDLAIQGEGYFAISTPDGERYTRAGNFTINDQGEMTTMDGNRVLDNSGQPIVFEPEDVEITVFSDGRVEVDGEERGVVGVYNFSSPSALKKDSNNLFRSDEVPVVSENGSIAQGMIENSNVKPILEMTKIIEVQRDYERTHKFINAIYELQEDAIRRTGREG